VSIDKQQATSSNLTEDNFFNQFSCKDLIILLTYKLKGSGFEF